MNYLPVLSIGSGGMAEIFLGTTRAVGDVRPLVVIKRPHRHLLRDRAFRTSLLHEARIASRIHHANVVGVRDVIADGDRVELVMEYVEGVSLAELIDRARGVPPAVAIRIVLDACAGLHAAHELTDDAGKPLDLVHRDVSPQNILVGLDGVARVIDFGIAKSLESATKPTTDGSLKGKIAYMAPEYVDGRAVDRRSDVFALGVVLWELLAGDRLFKGRNEGEILERVARGRIPKLRDVAPDLSESLGPVVARALDRVPEARYATARAFATALEEAARESELIASYDDVGARVRAVAGPELAERRKKVREEYARVTARRWWPLAAAAVVVVMGIAIGVVSFGDRRVTPAASASGSGTASASVSVSVSVSASASASGSGSALKPKKFFPPSKGPKPPPNPY